MDPTLRPFLPIVSGPGKCSTCSYVNAFLYDSRCAICAIVVLKKALADK